VRVEHARNRQGTRQRPHVWETGDDVLSQRPPVPHRDVVQREARPGQGWDRLQKGLTFLALACVVIVGLVPPTGAASQAGVYRIDPVSDGDTVVLRNGLRVRLVQIDTPEVYFGAECYGPEASATTKSLLPPGTPVRLYLEPATDRVDQYGRLLRYIVRARDRLNVNVQLVRVGAAAPYFYRGRRGRYASLLERLALRARARKLGLWRRCPHTPYDPTRGVSTRR
jgi:endonuclease YncB( thermonuclease family)